MRGRREHRASNGGAALFLLRLRAVALAAEDIDSPMVVVAHELRRLCVSCVFSHNVGFAVPSSDFVNLCRQVHPPRPDFARFGGSPLHEHCD